MFTFEEVQKVDPEVAAAIAQENDRQQSHLELSKEVIWMYIC